MFKTKFIVYHIPANKYINNFTKGLIIIPKIEILVIIPNKINPNNILFNIMKSTLETLPCWEKYKSYTATNNIPMLCRDKELV